MSVVEVHDAGSQVRASVGDELVIRLAENATTGYQWKVAPLASTLAVEASELEVDREGAPGARGRRLVRLRAVQPGDVTVRLTLERSWEQARPQDEFVFVVRVRLTGQVALAPPTRTLPRLRGSVRDHGNDHVHGPSYENAARNARLDRHQPS